MLHTWRNKIKCSVQVPHIYGLILQIDWLVEYRVIGHFLSWIVEKYVLLVKLPAWHIAMYFGNGWLGFCLRILNVKYLFSSDDSLICNFPARNILLAYLFLHCFEGFVLKMGKRHPYGKPRLCPSVFLSEHHNYWGT